MEVERVHAEVECGLKIGGYVCGARSASRAGHRLDKQNSLFRPRPFALQHTLRFSMCTDAADDYLNALRAPEGDAKATITLKYGPYMN